MPAAICPIAAELHQNLERKRNYQTSHMGFTVVLDLNLQLQTKVGFSFWIFFFCVFMWDVHPYKRRDVETLTDHQLLLDLLEKWVFVLVFSFWFSALLKSPPSVCSSEAESSTGDLGAILNTEQPAESWVSEERSAGGPLASSRRKTQPWCLILGLLVSILQRKEEWGSRSRWTFPPDWFLRIRLLWCTGELLFFLVLIGLSQLQATGTSGTAEKQK